MCWLFPDRLAQQGAVGLACRQMVEGEKAEFRFGAQGKKSRQRGSQPL